MFRSAAIRLTLWYLLIVMLVSVSFSFVLYGALRDELNVNIENQFRFVRNGPPPGQTQNQGQSPGQGRTDTPTPQSTYQPQIQAGDRPAFEEIRRRQIDDSSREIRERLLYINLVILLLGAGASYLLARRTLQPIQEALDAQSRFTADASHELRTPLTAMRSEIEVALRDKKPTLKDNRVLLKSSLEEIAKLETLSRGLLELASYENGRVKLELKPVKLKPIAEMVHKRLSSKAAARSITIKVSVPAKLAVKGEANRLTELLTILTDNAIKYGKPKGTVKIEAKAKGQHVTVEVIDDGIGIKASELPFLFNRFYRADSSRSRRNVEGYGLGLAMASQITVAHKGKIDAQSRPDHGSTFTVTLPAA